MARTKQTARVNTTTASINLSNLSPGETIHQRALLLRGSIDLPPNTPTVSTPSYLTITTTGDDGEPSFPEQTWPLTRSGHFKALILLTPGPNDIRIHWQDSPEIAYHSATLHITLTYLPLVQTPPLHLAILVASDSPLLMDCPSFKAGGLSSAHASLDAATRKLRMAAYMWQAGTAEDMRAKGLGRRAFRLEEDWGVDTLSSAFFNTANEDPATLPAGVVSPHGATAKVHVVRTERTVAELRKRENQPHLSLWFRDALKKHGGPFNSATGNTPDFVVAGLVLDSHYSAVQHAILADPQPPHRATSHPSGGIALAAFGSHTCWAWPRFVEELPYCLLDATQTSPNTTAAVSMADENDSGAARHDAAWQACAAGHAGMLRAVGRAFAAASHPSPSPMRELDARLRPADGLALQRDYASVFLPSIARGVHPLDLLGHGIAGSEQLWGLGDALALRCAPQFRVLGDEGAAVVARRARGEAPVVQTRVVGGRVKVRIAAEGGVARIVLRGQVEEWPNVAEPAEEREWAVETLEERFGREEPLEVRAMSMNGKERVVANLWALLGRLAFVKVPGVDVVLHKQSVKAGEIEAHDSGEHDQELKYWEWAAMLKERGADGKLTHATSFDMRVGCILDGGVLYYNDGHKTHLGPRITEHGAEHHFGGHASEEISLSPFVDIAKVEIHRNSDELVGMRVTLADGTVGGELHENDRYGQHAEIVTLKPDAGERTVGFFGRSDWKRGFNGIQEFGIITAPSTAVLPDSMYDLAELKNTDGGLEEVQLLLQSDGSSKRSFRDNEDYGDEEWDQDRD